MDKLTILHPNEVAIPDVLGQAANDFTKQTTFDNWRMGLTPATIRTHKLCLGYFADFLAVVGNGSFTPSKEALLNEPESWSGVTFGLLRQFTNYLLAEGYALGTINIAFNLVKSYCKQAFLAGALSEQSWLLIKATESLGDSSKKLRNIDLRREEQGIPVRRGKKKIDWVRLTPAQIGILKFSHNPDTPKGRRDKVIFCIFADLGIRASELANLKVEDINLQERLLTVYRIKTNLRQTLRMTEDVYEALVDYITHDAPRKGLLLLKAYQGAGKLTKCQGLSPSGLSRQVKRIARKLLSIEISAHDLRHYWADSAVKAGSSRDAVQAGGGWSSQDMIDVYVDGNTIANEYVKLLETPKPKNFVSDL